MMHLRCTRAAALISLAAGDIYLHSPRGSNNKLNEVSNNVNNNNRLFDSQNNDAGGYQVGDACDPVCSDANGGYDETASGAGNGTMYYYVGSVLPVEWTAQHGCGTKNSKVDCTIVLQYACEVCDGVAHIMDPLSSLDLTQRNDGVGGLLGLARRRARRLDDRHDSGRQGRVAPRSVRDARELHVLPALHDARAK
jgi:hypothetical protein